MNNDDLKYFKDKLENQKQDVIGKLKTMAVQADQVDTENWEAKEEPQQNQAVETVELAEEMEAFAIDSAITEDLEVTLREVDEALKLIENCMADEECLYGVDKFDGEPIERERLEANPAARTRMANIDRTV